MLGTILSSLGESLPHAKTMFAPTILKLLLVAGASALSGEVFFIFQGAPGGAPFYEHPSVIAAFAGIVSTVLVLIGNEIRERYKRKKDLELTDKERAHITTERLTELKYADRQKLDEALERVFGQERTFLQNRIDVLEESEYESRVRAHNAINEVQRFQNYLIRVSTICSKAGVELPEFQVKSYEELMQVTPQSITELKRMDARENKRDGQS